MPKNSENICPFCGSTLVDNICDTPLYMRPPGMKNPAINHKLVENTKAPNALLVKFKEWEYREKQQIGMSDGS